MATGTYQVCMSIGGVTINKQISRTGDHPNPYADITLPIGQAGVIVNRTDNDTTDTTQGATPTVVNADLVDVYWSGGVRYGMTVANVATNTLSLDGGARDALPVNTTAIVVTEQVVINTQIDGDAVQLFGVCAEYVDANSTAKAHIVFHDAANAAIKEIDLTANIPYVWDVGSGDTNPLTGNAITHSHASNGSIISTEAATLKVISLDDSTP